MIRLILWRVLAVVLVGLFVCSPGFCRTDDNYTRAIRHFLLLSNSENVRILPFGRSSDGRAIPACVISDFSADCSTKPRVLVCAGQHGDEYHPIRSLLALSEELAFGKHRDLLRKCVVIVAPMVNPDGVAAATRANAAGIDINRDWIKRKTCEAEYLASLISQWKPQVLIDLHEWLGPSVTPGNSIEVPYCEPSTRRLAAAAVASQAADNSGLDVILCTAASNPALFHRRYSAQGYAAYLIETSYRRDQLAKSRSYRQAVLTILKDVAADPERFSTTSPASRSFQAASLKEYLRPTHSENYMLAAGWESAGLVAVFCVLVWVVKPPRKSARLLPPRHSRRQGRAPVTRASTGARSAGLSLSQARNGRTRAA